ncbi:uncharacterized protein LOC108837759 [Raphanus sativus]|uniref:Uncharacterized protein LOC108837759 n=1 Tax=Raphanus sativus TaxID=3726 RepID=A0A6J0M1F0_RAPSA|nr:uncharacterized protein LOC108837759 [Raphanus sativus]
MASSSHYHYHREDNDQLDSMFDDLSEEDGDIFPEPKERKKRIFIERNREEGATKLWNDYFSESPTYGHRLFRRRFRMNKPLFMRIVNRLSTEVPYFRPTQDATGRSGLTPLQKCTAAIRQLAYGVGADTVDEYVRLGETTAAKCLHRFAAGIIHLFGDQYLRRPTPEDLQRLLFEGEERGFPGMIGSIDCMHWEWKNCPSAWKGMYSRGTGKPTLVLEAVASYDLWIWHAFFGASGTMNDLNILDRSPVFDDIINGIAPQVNFNVNGREYHLAYYLTDGIYPKWATFIQSIRLPQGEKNKLFAKKQESVRKDVERAFGVLQARFAVVKNPSKLWEKEKIKNIMKACIILHNMIVENERGSYSLRNISEFIDGEGEGAYSVGLDHTLRNTIDARRRIQDTPTNQRLKADLIENIWAKFGHLPNNI